MTFYTYELIKRIRPTSIESILLNHGFEKVRVIRRNANDVCYEFRHRQTKASVLFPEEDSANYFSRLTWAIEDIAEFEGRSSFYVVADLIGATVPSTLSTIGETKHEVEAGVDVNDTVVRDDGNARKIGRTDIVPASRTSDDNISDISPGLERLR